METFYDVLSSFELGVNSGVSPVLLPKNQLSWAINATVRGGFISDRPPIFIQSLNYQGNTTLKNVVETGLFQGAEVYRPDYGASQVIAQIAGHIIAFTANGGEWIVTDISIPGDYNDSTTSQVWMWQAERWMIISDGTGALPIFYDGTSCRRSYGPSVSLGTVNAVVSPATPADAGIGGYVQLTMAAPYTGPYDVAVLFNGAIYQTSSNSIAAPNTQLQNLSDTPGDVVPDGSEIFIVPDRIGIVRTSLSAPNGRIEVTVATGSNTVVPGEIVTMLSGIPGAGTTFVVEQITQTGVISKFILWISAFGGGVPLSAPGVTVHWMLTRNPVGTPTVPAGIVDGNFVIPADAGPPTCTVAVNATATVVGGNCSGFHYREFANLQVDDVTGFYVGAIIVGTITGPAVQWKVSAVVDSTHLSLISVQQFFGCGSSPNDIVGGTTISTTSNSPGGTVQMRLESPYTGVPDQSVWILEEIFTISAIPVLPSTTLYLINLNDTSTVAYGTAPHTLPDDLLSVPELPAGRMGAYGMGRNWICLTDGVSYVAGDIVGGEAGTVAYDYRDAVLKTTENDFLAAGGKFRLPESGNIITSMTFVPTLDTAQGQGPLQIGTDSSMFSNNTPVDRGDWAVLTNPIQTQSLIGQGPIGQRSTKVSNSDVLFRSIEGLGSLKIARRDFNQDLGGNTPISREVERALVNDIITLLPYGSSINFDNRWITTCYPQVSGVGVYHKGMVALNFDLVSNLRGKAPPVYDGLWTGLNFLQLTNGNFSGTGRAFAFSFNENTSKTELYELLRARMGHFDNGDVPIQWSFETCVMFREDIKKHSQLIRLIDGDFEIQDVDGRVTIQVEYRPDYYPCWVLWRELEVCADLTKENSQPGYRTRLALGDPPGPACELSNNRQLRVGHFFQFKFTITGHCKFMGFRVQATAVPESDFAKTICATTCPETIPIP